VTNRRVIGWVSLAISAKAALIFAFLRFRHPDWTEAEAVLKLWPLAALMAVAMIVFVWKGDIR